ncbi:hypothetical protein B0O99DRAFT_680499 [Bisporella sp. PMI_857]|nr:hypothetical protein B0O99DRAFT_680499 [Bisporella sp. PMI_857]
MARSNPGGRPKLDWTASRNRKLGRLYLLTDITVQDIQQLLKEDKFSPSVRSIQAQLSLLLPNNVKDWRQYRPTERKQMVNRLAQLKRARQDRVSKYSYRPSSRPCLESKPVPTITTQVFRPQTPTPYYDPCRYYKETSSCAPEDFTLKPSCPDSDQPLSNTPISPTEILSLHAAQKRSSESVALDDCHDRSDTTVSPSYSGESVPSAESPASTALDSDVQCITPTSEQSSPTSGAPIAKSEPNVTAEIAAAWAVTGATNLHELTNGRGLTKAIGKLASKRMVASLRRAPSLLSSKMSHCLSHIESVLSTTNSWRSSLIDAMSLSSDRYSNPSELHLSREEYRTWDELVDMSKFSSTLGNHTESDAISLKTRPCCEFFENDIEKRVLCKVCGFSEAHSLARNSMSDDGSLINCTVVDRFGNTPLHHAAAAGNYRRVLQLLDFTSNIHARNTSGETFLHVIDLEANDDVKLDEVLRKASDLVFDFSAKEFRGGTVHSRLQDSAHFLWNEQYKQWIFQESNLLPNVDGQDEPQRQQPMPSVALWKRRLESETAGCDDLNGDGDTQLIVRLRKWPTEPMSPKDLEKLIRQSNVHMRAKRGYTAMAIAVRHGIRDAVMFLLECGANPNNRSNRKTSIMGFAAACLAKAQKDQDSGLYSRILSCIVLIADHGGIAEPTVYDEYTLRAPVVRGKPSARTIQTTKEVYKPFVTVDNS